MTEELFVKKCKDFLDNLQTGNLQHVQLNYIRTLVLQQKPKTILETGVNDLLSSFWDPYQTSLGATSTRAFLVMRYLLSLEGVEGELYSIDIRRGKGMEKIEQSEFGKYWRPFFGKSSLEVDWTGKPPIDFFFVDGAHTFEGVYGDLTHFKPYFSDKIIIILHDYSNREDGHRVKAGALEFIYKNPEFTVEQIPLKNEYGLFYLGEIRRKA